MIRQARWLLRCGGALVTTGVAIIAVCPILLAGLRGSDRPGSA